MVWQNDNVCVCVCVCVRVHVWCFIWFKGEVGYVRILEVFQKLSELLSCLVECPPHPLFTICHLCFH